MARHNVFLLIALLVASSAFAQFNPVATLNGKVTADGAPLPGVTVTVSSPNLQGTRTAVTTDAGDYILPFLPPGPYKVKFELSGMQTVQRNVELSAARTERVDAELRPTAVAESITVTAATPLTAAVESTQVSTNFKADLIENLPVGRNLTSIALLAPGVNSNGPGGNVIISGAMSFDSLYLVNGVIVNENLRGQPDNLFIEDAVQEQTVFSAGVSAEYGHFTGGVVSTLTKSGGNELSGSLRANLSNETWTAKTKFTTDQEDKINPIYEGTFGGPFLRDRLWFFAAGRMRNTETFRQTVPGLARQGDQDAAGNQLAIGSQITPLTYPYTEDEKRYEIKLTGALTPRHTVVASYLDVSLKQDNQTGQTVMDLDSLVPSREVPDTLVGLNYNGMMTDSFFIEGQYSEKKHAFLHSGSTFYDNIKGTLITDRARGTRYWSPTFRNTPDGEHRNITVYTGKATYFLSTENFGSHEAKVGFEHFLEVRDVNNWQNGSEFRISVPQTIIRGGTIYPRMPGGSTGTLTRISWLPILVLSEGSQYKTNSLYLNDRWTLSDRWTFNLGVRWDKNDALSGAHTFKIADDSAFSPRVAAHYDLFKDGRLILNASYGQYVGRLAEGAANDADPAGRNASLQWNYQGPSINSDVNTPTSQLIPTEQAIKMIFDWFFANGGTARRPFRTTPSVPGVESILDVDGLKSPKVNEATIGAGMTFGSKGFARADYIWRNWDNFYTSYRNISTGQTQDQFGTKYDLSIIRSDGSVYEREYKAVQTQFQYRVLNPFTVGGTYTWSRLTGNVTGEDSGSGPLVGGAGEYPEYRQASWNYPTGYLTGDQRHRLRLWGAYDLRSRFGDFNLSVLEAFDSGTRTSVDADIDSRPYVTNPGYLTPPATVTYYFGGRGILKTDNITRTDLALNYRYRLPRGIEIFVQPEILNIFNEQGVVAYDEEVLTAVDCAPQTTGTLQAPCPAKGLQPFNPFKDKPVEGVNYIKGPTFGLPNSEGDFQTPRTYRISMGIRF